MSCKKRALSSVSPALVSPFMSTTNVSTSSGLRVVVVTNYYPPYFIGGYELGCRDVVEALKSRGHQVRVLTSTYGVNRPEHSGDVYRWLATDLSLNINGSSEDLIKVIRKESANRRAFNRIAREF